MVLENSQAWSNEGEGTEAQRQGSGYLKGGKQQIKQTAQNLAQQAKGRVSEAAEKGKQMAEGRVEDGKRWAADELGHFSSALRSAAEKLREEQDERVASYADMCAARIDQATNYLRGRSAGDLVNQACSVARRHPEMVMGGMFVLGLAIARFLKASEPSYDYAQQYGAEAGQWQDEGQPVGAGPAFSGSMGSGPESRYTDI